jgi:putative NADH-flavin reductase
MNIALIGATGGIGSRVLDEALRRGHTVTATSRDPANKLPPRSNMTAKAVNTADVAATAAVLRRHDAGIVSLKWNEAGSLIRKDGRTHFEHMAEKGITPPTSKPAALAFEEMKTANDLDWTAISPAASIQPGERTGKFRLGLDHLIEDEEGESRISREDFAIAILDELERPTHVQKRFTAGY